MCPNQLLVYELIGFKTSKHKRVLRKKTCFSVTYIIFFCIFIKNEWSVIFEHLRTCGLYLRNCNMHVSEVWTPSMCCPHQIKFYFGIIFTSFLVEKYLQMDQQFKISNNILLKYFLAFWLEFPMICYFNIPLEFCSFFKVLLIPSVNH